jgi:hypothetical protein
MQLLNVNTGSASIYNWELKGQLQESLYEVLMLVSLIWKIIQNFSELWLYLIFN